MGKMMQFTEMLNYYISLFVVCSPLPALPLFLELTQGKTEKEKKKTALKTIMSVATILILITWVGIPLLKIFGIQLHAFQVAGGFVLILIALSMLNPQPNKIQQLAATDAEKGQKESIATFPLAIPMIVGPGAITTVIVSSSIWPGPFNALCLSLSSIAVALTAGSILYFSSRVEKLLKPTGINIVNRIGGLILASMAVQSITNGLRGLLFP